MCDVGSGADFEPGSFDDFCDLYSGRLLALWLGFSAERHATLDDPHLFQFLTFDAFLDLAYRMS
jgi:hypothetical protein